MRYSKLTGGFYPEEIDYPSLPDDVVHVDNALSQEAIHARANGAAVLDVIGGELVIVPVPPKSNSERISELRAIAAHRISQRMNLLRKRIAGTGDEIEIAAWSNKLRIAMAIESGSATANDIAVFGYEIDRRSLGETVPEFCAKVIHKAWFYGSAVALIDGTKRKWVDAINALESAEEIESAIASAAAEAETAISNLYASITTA